MKYAFGFRERLDDVEMPDFVKIFAARGEKVREISVGTIKRFEIDDGIPHLHQVLVELPKPSRTIEPIPPMPLYFAAIASWSSGDPFNPTGFAFNVHDQQTLVLWSRMVSSLIDSAASLMPETRTIFVRVMEERGCIFTISSENI